MSAFVTPNPLVITSSGQSAAITPLRFSAGSLHAAAASTRTLFARARPAFHGPSLSMAMDMDEDVAEDVAEDIGDRPGEEPQEAPGLEEAKLFVGNLSWGTTDQSLGEAFSKYGNVLDSRVVVDHFTGKSRGFGFIEYESASEAEEALLRMNGVEVDGRPVRVDRANKRPNKRRSSFY